MKIIITGANGYVATEVIQQALSLPSLTSLVLLSRKPVTLPPSSPNVNRIKNLTTEDYCVYPDNVKKELAGASACVWTVAITPSKSRMYNSEDLRRINHEATIQGLRTILEAGVTQPFRFVYVSGDAVNEEQIDSPPMMPEYVRLRWETDQAVRKILKEQRGEHRVFIPRPGLVTSNANMQCSVVGALLKMQSFVPTISREELAAAIVYAATNDMEKEAMRNEELRAFARKVREPRFDRES